MQAWQKPRLLDAKVLHLHPPMTDPGLALRAQSGSSLSSCSLSCSSGKQSPPALQLLMKVHAKSDEIEVCMPCMLQAASGACMGHQCALPCWSHTT